MTKDEFLSMINNEIENLEQEYETTRKKIEYFKAINKEGKEYQGAEYNLRLIQQKIDSLRRFVSLPAYARIQAMSDIEIEDYKKGKIEELELKIKEIEAIEEQEKAKLSQLKAEQEQLMVQFGSFYGEEREKAIQRGQQIAAEITRYDANNQWGVFAQHKKEIEEIRKQQEQIKAMTSQEIKQKLSSEIEGSHNLAQSVEYTEMPIDSFTELKASVAQDPEKAQQMATLLTLYQRLSDQQGKIKGRLYLEYGLPKLLQRRLTEHDYYYNPKTYELSNPDKLMEIVREYESSFEQSKATFMEQFTEQKLSKLIDRQHGVDSSEVDMEFLELHSDKIGAGELSQLQSLVEQRDKLSKKIFKTQNTKLEIKNLNAQIKYKQSKIYKEILGWYESQNKDILGIGFGIQLYSLDALRHSLETCNKDIVSAENAINEMKEKIERAKREMEQQNQMYEARKDEFARQIRALGGEKHQETNIPSYVADRADFNLEQIMNAHNRVYQKDVVERVQQEAQNQANTKEAELRETTVEQLLQMRQQAQAMLDGSKVESTEEEVSHGMKM